MTLSSSKGQGLATGSFELLISFGSTSSRREGKGGVGIPERPGLVGGSRFASYKGTGEGTSEGRTGIKPFAFPRLTLYLWLEGPNVPQPLYASFVVLFRRCALGLGPVADVTGCLEISRRYLGFGPPNPGAKVWAKRRLGSFHFLWCSFRTIEVSVVKRLDQRLELGGCWCCLEGSALQGPDK